MSLLKVKAKVKLSSEDRMEIEATYDLGDMSGSQDQPYWEWKNIAIPFEDVYRLIEFSPKKTLVVMYDTGEQILIQEEFESIYKRWDEMRLKFGDFERRDNEEGETSSAEEEE